MLFLCVCLFSASSVSAQRDSVGTDGEKSPITIDFKDPPNIKTIYNYDAKTGNYLEILTIGGKPVGAPKVLTLGAYLQAKEKQEKRSLLS